MEVAAIRAAPAPLARSLARPLAAPAEAEEAKEGPAAEAGTNRSRCRQRVKRTVAPAFRGETPRCTGGRTVRDSRADGPVLETRPPSLTLDVDAFEVQSVVQ